MVFLVTCEFSLGSAHLGLDIWVRFAVVFVLFIQVDSLLSMDMFAMFRRDYGVVELWRYLHLLE